MILVTGSDSADRSEYLAQLVELVETSENQFTPNFLSIYLIIMSNQN